MLNELYDKHIKMLKKTFECSSKILDYALISDLESVMVEIDNRDRLINILGLIQSRIDEFISENQLEEEALKQTKDWNFLSGNEFKKINEADLLIIQTLEQNKDELSKEISRVFRSRMNVKKYNLTSVSG